MTDKERKKPEFRHTWHPNELLWSHQVNGERVDGRHGSSKPTDDETARILLIKEYHAIVNQKHTDADFDQRKYSKDELVKRLPWLYTENVEKTKASVNGKLRSIRNKLKKLNEKKEGSVVIPALLSWLPPQKKNKVEKIDEEEAVLLDLFKAK